MLTLIAVTTFVIVPSICIASIGLWDGMGRIELPEPSCIAWHEEVDSIDFSFAATQKIEAIGLESLHLLFDDMDAFGIELAYISVHPTTGAGLVVLEDEVEVEIDVSEFSDACNPSVVPAVEILSINDEDSQLSHFQFADTVVELPKEVSDTDLAEMVTNLLTDDDSFLSAGSDEATFFYSTSWDEDYITIETPQKALTITLRKEETYA